MAKSKHAGKTALYSDSCTAVKRRNVLLPAAKPLEPFWFYKHSVIGWVPLRWQGVVVYIIYWYDLFATMYYLRLISETLPKAIGLFIPFALLYTLLLVLIVHLKCSPRQERKAHKEVFSSQAG